MCARPRRFADQHIIEAAIRVVGERGAEHMRLADVAAVSGLAPATLVQRFGSREALLDAIATAHVAGVGAAFSGSTGSPLANLRRSLADIAAARHAAFFIPRPAGAAVYSLELRKHIAFSLASAIERGELPHCDVASLARRVQISYYGLTAAALLEGGILDEPAIEA
ncbi:MAG: TetR/AcrR family transcriptional regulator, partial [Gemmatimonadota bacterium]